MRFFILTDLEGTAGVYKWSQVTETSSEEYRQAKIWMTEEVNSCVEGILEVMPDSEIIVWDGHGHGGIEITRLHPEAKLIPRGFIRAPYTFDQGYDGIFMIAQHAMAGTGGNLCHTYSLKVYRYWLNGKEIGEIGLRAYLAGYFGIPVLLVSGDDYACREAKEFIPDVEVVEVKKTIHNELAILISQQKANKLIKEGTKRVLGRIDKIKPVKIPPPYTFRAQFLSTTVIKGIIHSNPQMKEIDPYTVEISGEDFVSVVGHFA